MCIESLPDDLLATHTQLQADIDFSVKPWPEQVSNRVEEFSGVLASRAEQAAETGDGGQLLAIKTALNFWRGWLELRSPSPAY